MNKWTNWYDSLPEHTKEYLKNQPLWHDIDLVKAGIVGLIVGFLLGLLF
jgi:ElaB/YqjD/DUF883 family membrane-anchored ribosome-binding protein